MLSHLTLNFNDLKWYYINGINYLVIDTKNINQGDINLARILSSFFEMFRMESIRETRSKAENLIQEKEYSNV